MSIVRCSPYYFLPQVALRACLFLLLSVVSCQASSAPQRLASPGIVFTPSLCNSGRLVSADQLPASCTHTWFLSSDESNQTSHATSSSSSRAVLQFEGSGVSWFAAPVTQVRGTADVYIDDVRLDRVQLSPNNTGSSTPAWSSVGLDSSSMHNLTIVPLGDDIITVRFFSLVPSHNSASEPVVRFTTPLNAAVASEHDSAAEKDRSSISVISFASIGAVALVVAVCGGCFFLGKRRKSPGFHMPTVLVDIESALDSSDPPSPTTIRAWRESMQRSYVADAAGEPNHDRYPPNGSHCSRPPSYQYGTESYQSISLYRSDSSHSQDGPWQ